MSNIFDYLDWRGDIPLSVDPFNEVDSLSLAVLAYVDFAGIVPGPRDLNLTGPIHPGMEMGAYPALADSGEAVDKTEGAVSEERIPHITISEACTRFWEKHTEEEIRNSGTLFANIPFILEKLCGGARFGKMKLTAYVNYISAENNEQISAVTCLLDDGTAYVAYGGTDDTLIGWKEDFSFSFSNETGGQSSAVRYLTLLPDYIGKNFPLRIGGHSKGGNFSIYAAAFCDSKVKNDIIGVYEFDSPGFSADIIETLEMRELASKIHSYVPEETIFGLLLEKGCPHSVVRSSAKGVWQHDALTWLVKRNRFEKGNAISEISLILEKSLETWLEGMSVEDRKEFVDIIFSRFDESGLENLSEITMDQFRSIPELIRAYHEMNQNDKRFLRDTVGKLFASGAKCLNEEIRTMLSSQISGKDN